MSSALDACGVDPQLAGRRSPPTTRETAQPMCINPTTHQRTTVCEMPQPARRKSTVLRTAAARPCTAGLPLPWNRTRLRRQRPPSNARSNRHGAQSDIRCGRCKAHHIICPHARCVKRAAVATGDGREDQRSCQKEARNFSGIKPILTENGLMLHPARHSKLPTPTPASPGL